MPEEKTVLIVEDEKNIVDILRFNLERKGYRVLEAYDGEEGLRKARTEKPDLILLDIRMAPKDGLETLRDIRAMEGRADVSVIMLTGMEDKNSVLESTKLGICDYILKPFLAVDLLNRVRRVLDPDAVDPDYFQQKGASWDE